MVIIHFDAACILQRKNILIHKMHGCGEFKGAIYHKYMYFLHYQSLHWFTLQTIHVHVLIDVQLGNWGNPQSHLCSNLIHHNKNLK
jgi:hypothetical protein